MRVQGNLYRVTVSRFSPPALPAQLWVLILLSKDHKDILYHRAILDFGT